MCRIFAVGGNIADMDDAALKDRSSRSGATIKRRGKRVLHRRQLSLGQLGKRGRWRSNVWTYPGASSLGSDARRGLKDHPTVKPTAMLEDALLDLTNRGDIIIDPFLGSGSTLIAADKTGRACRGDRVGPALRRCDRAPISDRDRQPGGSRRDWRGFRPTGRAEVKGSGAGLGSDREARPQQY